MKRQGYGSGRSVSRGFRSDLLSPAAALV